MKYKFNGKNINIPNETLENYQKTFKISESEAITMFLEEEGILENSEIEKLSKKARKVNNRATETKPREKKNVERKADEVKGKLITEIIKFLEKYGAMNIEIVKVEKLLRFNLPDGNIYKLDLIRERKKKGE